VTQFEFIIDVVVPTVVEFDDWDDEGSHHVAQNKVQMKSYKVWGGDAQEALEKLVEGFDEAEPFYVGEPIGVMIVGLEPTGNQLMTA
jgi:hypothetical protein